MYSFYHFISVSYHDLVERFRVYPEIGIRLNHDTV